MQRFLLVENRHPSRLRRETKGIKLRLRWCPTSAASLDSGRVQTFSGGPLHFSLDFLREELLYMNHIAIFQIAKFDVRENHINEERSQESRRKEESCSEEKEVAAAFQTGRRFN